MIYAFVAATFFSCIALWIGHSRYRWNQEIKSMEYKLLHVNDTNKEYFDKIENDYQQTWDDLPVVVQDYLYHVFEHLDDYNKKLKDQILKPAPKIVNEISYINFKQSGLFQMKEKWYPFSAHQILGANSNNVGFVWDANIYIGSNWYQKLLPYITVCDAYIEGNGHLRANLGSFIPVASDKDFNQNNNELMKGELMRWLAESFITPTALLPNAGIVIWKNGSDEKQRKHAVLQMKNITIANEPVELTVFFEKNRIEIRGFRPFKEENSFQNREWVGWLSNFQLVDKILIPTYFEVGWVNPETNEIDLYFKGNNTSMKIKYIPKPDTIISSKYMVL